MDDMIMELAKYRIEKAKNDFIASKLLLKSGLLSQSLNRAYYSMFHAVRAVIAFEEFDSKKHSGIIAYFNRNFISTGIFEKEYAKILMGAEKMRNKSDYNDFYIPSKKEVEQQVKNAEKFLEVMDDYVRKLTNTK